MPSGFHEHFCQRCGARYACAQITHCSRPDTALCPAHAMEEQSKLDVDRAVASFKPIDEMFAKVFGVRR